MHESKQSSLLPESDGNRWERRPPGPDDHRLLERTWRWLAALPTGARPVRLPSDFPRIANDLARLWPETAALDLYLDEKEFSARPVRQGFPPIVKEELLALHLHSLRSRSLALGKRVPQQMALIG